LGCSWLLEVRGEKERLGADVVYRQVLLGVMLEPAKAEVDNPTIDGQQWAGVFL
jgi:hypothetical protein